jgi:hypothetical protein
MISTIKSGDAMNLLPLQNYLDGKLPLEHLPQPAHAMLKQDILVSVLILHMRDLIDRSNAASILSPHYDAQEVQEAAARVEKLVGEKKAGLVKAFVTTMAQLPPSSRVDTVTQLPPLSNPKNGAAGSVKKPLRPIPTS